MKTKPSGTQSLFDSLLNPKRSPVDVLHDFSLLLFEQIKAFFVRGGVTRAAALTYTTLLSLIPLLGLVVIVFKQVGGFGWLTEQLMPFLATYLSPDGSAIISEFLLTRMAELELDKLGLVGVLFLGVGVYSLITTIETDFNGIWRVKRSRGFIQRVGSYWFLMMLLPVIAGVSVYLSGEATVSRLVAVLPEWVGEARGHLMPILVQFAGFFFLYWALPNTRVRVMPAMVGAAFAAASWELAKIGFTFYALRAGSYSLVYGSLATLPLFMIWVFLTWLLVLLGAELSFVIQNHRALLARRNYKRMGSVPEYMLALALREAVLLHFERGEEIRAAGLARLMGLPEAEINGVLQVMGEAGMMRLSRDPEGVLVLPGMPRETMDPAKVAGLFLSSPEEFSQHVDSAFLRAQLDSMGDLHKSVLEAFRNSGNKGDES